MCQPLITIIVPVYKVEQYLHTCVASITEQTYQNLEIILVDDGSPDRSGEMCDALALTDSRIRVIHKENGGLSSARNAGLDVMTGQYVAFVDSDDRIVPDMLQRLLSLMQTHHAQVAAGGMQTDTGISFNPDYPKDCSVQVFSRIDALREVTFNQKITNSFCDKLWDRSLFSTIRFPVGEYFEDMKTIHKCLELSDTIVYTPEPVYIYTMTPESISRGTFQPRMFEDAYAAKARADYYADKYPQLHQYAAAHYIYVYLHRIWQSRNTPSCDNTRKSLIRHLKGKLPEGAVSCLNRNNRFKLMALRISVPLYYFLMYLTEFAKRH